MKLELPDDLALGDLADALATIGLAIDARLDSQAGWRASWVGGPTEVTLRRGVGCAHASCAHAGCGRVPVVQIGPDLWCADHFLHLHRVGGDL